MPFRRSYLRMYFEQKEKNCKGVANVYWSIVVFILFIMTFIH